MNDETTEAMLRRMDAQLHELIGTGKKARSPEREVHISETHSDKDGQSVDLHYSISNEATLEGHPFICRLNQNRNPEDTSPSMLLNSPQTFSKPSFRAPSTTYSSEALESTNSFDSCASTPLLSLNGISLAISEDVDDRIQIAVDAIREEASRVETALAIDQIQTCYNEIHSLTNLLDAQSEQIRYLKKEMKTKDERLATLELERDLAKADIESLKAIRAAPVSAPNKRLNDDIDTTSSSRSVRLKDVGTYTEDVYLDLPEARQSFEDSSSSATIGSATRAHSMMVKKHLEQRGARQFQHRPPVPRHIEARVPQSASTSSNERSVKKPKHRIKFEVVSPSCSKTLLPTVAEVSSQVRNPVTDQRQTQVYLNAAESESSQSTLYKSKITTQNSIISSVSAPSQSPGTVRDATKPLGPITRHGLRPMIKRSKSLCLNTLSRRSVGSIMEEDEQRRKKRLCCVPPLFRRKTPPLINRGREDSTRTNIVVKKISESGSLQAQVEELAQRLKLSVDNSEGLRKRLAMISYYYENTVRRLQDNIVSLKKEMAKMEADLVKQVASVDRKRRNATKKSGNSYQQTTSEQQLPRQKDTEANISKPNRIYL